ncbi:unnamed protein product [Paramecium primaurelia]|uniref:Uncharacterized protein n=1 Tax=Paramecium primaurelia TaxID=5886 RepID=A0A8S1K8A0_PARPR|nr:unnamed protein product [Paramecium primaurelia]
MGCHKCFFTIAKFNHLKDYYAILNISQKIDLKKPYYSFAKKFLQDLNQEKEEKLMKRMKYKLIKLLTFRVILRSEEKLCKSIIIILSYQLKLQAYKYNKQIQIWNTRTANEQTLKKTSYIFTIKTFNQFAQETLFRIQREYQVRQQYQKRTYQFFIEKVREAYENYQRQQEYEQHQKRIICNSINFYEKFKKKPKNFEKALKKFIKLELNQVQCKFLMELYQMKKRMKFNNIQNCLKQLGQLSSSFPIYIYLQENLKIFYKQKIQISINIRIQSMIFLLLIENYKNLIIKVKLDYNRLFNIFQ